MLYGVSRDRPSSRLTQRTCLPSSELHGRRVSNAPEGARAIFGVVGVTAAASIATKAVASWRAAAAKVRAAISLALLLDDIANHDEEGKRCGGPGFHEGLVLSR